MANNSPKPNTTAVGVAIGAGVGAALFAATPSPVWTGVGVAIGAAIGAASQRNDTTEPEDRTDD